VSGAISYAEAKAALVGVIDRELAGARMRFQELRADEARLLETLGEGADRARAVARATLARVRRATGTGPRLSRAAAAAI